MRYRIPAKAYIIHTCKSNYDFLNEVVFPRSYSVVDCAAVASVAVLAARVVAAVV